LLQRQVLHSFPSTPVEERSHTALRKTSVSFLIICKLSFLSVLHKAYKYESIIFSFHSIPTFSPTYHSSSSHPIQISLNNFLTPFPLQLCSWECRVAPVLGLVSLLQDPVNHISWNSNGCLDTPFGTMHHAIVTSYFLKFFLFFPSQRILSHIFSLLVLGTVSPGSTISHGLLPEPYPFSCPLFILLSLNATCCTLEK